MFEVLPGLPAYGELPKVIGGVDPPVYREGYVIRFMGGTPQEWVGNFQRGCCFFDFTAHLSDKTHVLVISGGKAYIVDPVNQSISDSFGGQFDSCIELLDHSGYVLFDTTDIDLVGSSGRVWRSRRLAWDGLRGIEITSTHVRGEARHFDDSWHAFKVKLSDGIAEGGAFPGPEA